MDQKYDYEEKCVRCLLGELPEQEQAQLEEAYFADDELFERFLAVKDDMIDAYAREDYTGEKRARFEQHFLASEPRRQHVEESKEFIRAVSAASLNAAIVNGTLNAPTESSAASWWRSTSNLFALQPVVLRGTIATLLLVALVGSWAFVRHFQRQRAMREQLQNQETARGQQEEERGLTSVSPLNDNSTDLARNNATNLGTHTPAANLNNAPASERAAQPRIANQRSQKLVPAQIVSLSLLPFVSRDGNSSNSLTLGPDTRAVRLHLAFKEDSYRRYDVVLGTVDGDRVLQRRGLKARSDNGVKSVTLTLDPAVFRRQDYIATLNGLTAEGKLETISDYYFRVEQSPPKTTPQHPQ
ncbi:MAG: hypothetical protein H0T77_15325 [Pyrinomonadaceae bacterium]|nr:hypothetical protein [Pyrinomonadaceae bacterium]